MVALIIGVVVGIALSRGVILPVRRRLRLGTTGRIVLLTVTAVLVGGVTALGVVPELDPKLRSLAERVRGHESVLTAMGVSCCVVMIDGVLAASIQGRRPDGSA